MSAKKSSSQSGSAPYQGGGNGSAYPPSVDRLIAEFAKLPGIGRRSAERMAFHVLKSSKSEALQLSEAVNEVKKSVKHCAVCFNFTDGDRCVICDDPRRDASLVLVVEQPRDLIALEQTGMFRGVYHVLLGRLSPLDGVGPTDLTISDLLQRVDDHQHNARHETVQEIILGLNPTLEGDGTALFLADELKSRDVKVSRLARGLPSGGTLELANKAVLADAIEGRQSLR